MGQVEIKRLAGWICPVRFPPFSVEHLWIPLWNFSKTPIAEGHATYCLIIGHPTGEKNQCGIDD
jgi:hypothetical protein